MEALTPLLDSKPRPAGRSDERIKENTDFLQQVPADFSPNNAVDSYCLPVAAYMTEIDMERKHILVVDDEQNMLNTLGFILQAANYKVTTAKDGQEALQKTFDMLENHNNQIDLLITDLRLPRLTGLQLIDELNRLKMKMPIFVITGYGDKGLVIDLIRAGCVDYLEKPFNRKEFVKHAASLFGRAETRI